MTPTHFRLTTLLASLFLTAACSTFGNGKPLDAVPMPADPEKRFEVWSGGKSWQLHAVRIDGDTLRGVRWWHDPACDSCQVALGKNAVDSVRTSSIDGRKSGALVLFIIPFVAAVIWFKGISSN